MYAASPTSDPEDPDRLRGLLELVQEAGDVGFLDYAVASRSVTLSSGLSRMLGLGSRALRMTWPNWLHCIHHDDAIEQDRLIGAACQEKRERIGLKFRTAISPEVRWLSCRMGIQYGNDGAPIRMLGAMVDITSAQRAEQQARMAAESASRVKDEFLAMLGHELRNPLGAISAAIEALNRIHDQPDQALRARRIITRQTAHLSQMMDDLLDLVRIVAGKVLFRGGLEL